MGRRRTEGGEGEKVQKVFPRNIFDEIDKKVPRNAANARERTRMRVLSKAFGRLKLTLPWVPPDTKVIWLKGDAKPGKQPKIKKGH